MQMVGHAANEKPRGITPRMKAHAWSRGTPHFKPNDSPVRNHHPKPKNRLAALCHKPALLRIKLDETH